MKSLQSGVLEQLVAGFAEPVLVARIDSPDWPVVMCNAPFDALAGKLATIGKPFADVIEHLAGRDLALEVSESIRSSDETSFPVELGGREFLLVLRRLSPIGNSTEKYFAAYWRAGAGSQAGAVDSEAQQALLKAKRKIRDLSRDDPVTGLLNASAFRDVLAHDWAVAAREQSALALVCFSLDDFDAYLDVFGRHSADSCVRRVGQAIRRCLRRASDVAARVDDDKLIVLSHASEESGINEFADRIATSVRELGLHHPRSGVEKFVTVSHRISLAYASGSSNAASKFLDKLLAE
jgi:diguanylate cyclase (GGDEF)-like protein